MKQKKYEFADVRFGELWLKGSNRGNFIAQLISNMEAALQGESYSRIERLRDRLLVFFSADSNAKAIASKLSKVFGISLVFLGVKCQPALESMLQSVAILSEGKKNVKIEARRSYKLHGFSSVDMRDYIIGKAAEHGIVPERNSRNRVYVDALKDFAIVSDFRLKGSGGLPVGSSGSAVVLISGGIDSPLAAYLTMKRGLRPIYIHFHTFPDNRQAAESKMGSIFAKLSEYGLPAATYYVPSHIFQAYAASAPQRYELVLFKRFIYEFAMKVARREGAGAIATGESLGQVASQTLKNLSATQHGIDMLFFRPLIGMDKQEITDMSSRIGLYGYSIMKYRDVCSIRVRNPTTGAGASAVNALYAKYKLAAALDETASKSLRL
ncbi:MAG: tRNA 4-thiouridine(8) synthase ThiI [Candidatus Marsarchaeota archaeon]|nr:tRNA 4-thiouridine(8) synthase ThiI [Candidatus Marsarchaeota archaeon]